MPLFPDLMMLCFCGLTTGFYVLRWRCLYQSLLTLLSALLICQSFPSVSLHLIRSVGKWIFWMQLLGGLLSAYALSGREGLLLTVPCTAATLPS